MKKNTRRPKVGSKIKLWFDGGRTDKSSTVIAVRRYTGRYPEYFKWIVTASSVRISKGIEISI